jgi:hypothetical protein
MAGGKVAYSIDRQVAVVLLAVYLHHGWYGDIMSRECVDQNIVHIRHELCKINLFYLYRTFIPKP